MAQRLDRERLIFECAIAEAQNFAQRCTGARHSTHERAALTQVQFRWVYEVAALKMIVASERFFETTLGLYAIGSRTASGYRPRRRRRLTMSLPEVLATFRGDQPHVGWVNPGDIIARARKWLRNGEPFLTALSPTSQLLLFVQKMRNVIAHDSDSAYATYDRELRRLYGAMPRNRDPGSRLLEPAPVSLPGLTGTSLFDGVAATYRWIANTIVH